MLEVFRSNYLLFDLQRTWMKGITDRTWNILERKYANCCGIKQGTIPQDGRFPFLLQSVGLINARPLFLKLSKIKHTKDFHFHTDSKTVRIMVQVALRMRSLYGTNILYNDLKAPNCLLHTSPSATLTPR